ncbi:MAG: GNAT family N-acetyltransferase, partial [Planctomycetota bacterium]
SRSGGVRASDPSDEHVEVVPPSDRGAMVAAIGDAFAEHPMIPADPTGGKSRLMAVAMLDAFADAPDHRWFGVRRGGELACVAFVYGYGYDPPLRKMPRMLWRMVRMVGLRKAVTYGRLMSEKHPGDDRRLQLLILGTAAAHQGKGLGRVMMRHVIGFAEGRGYDAVVLEVAKHTPAYGFYEREGFVVEKEIALPEMPLVYMRREISRAV